MTGSRRPSGVLVRPLVLLVVLALLLMSTFPSAAQVQDGATLTVLRGQVAVLRTDGSSIQPAASGTTVLVTISDWP